MILLNQVRKRDGSIVNFDASKIFFAITRAGIASNEFNDDKADELTKKVLTFLESNQIQDIEHIQDTVEKVLWKAGFLRTARAYIVYREQHALLRADRKIPIDVVASIDEYLNRADWRVNANANQGYSLGGLILNSAGKMIANYWLSHVYPPEIGNAHREADIHIHDLDFLAGYCSGWSLRMLLQEGLNGVPGKVEAAPPKHMSSAIGQIVNFLGTLQNEWAGAQAFSSFDTYMAPYIRVDKLDYLQIKQNIQELIYNLNVPSRWGNQTVFSNLTFDWVCPEDLKAQVPIIGGKEVAFTYGDLQYEMDLINKAYIEVMTEGDDKGRIFTFPIPTYNITDEFPWNSENANLLFNMTAKYGLPYFQNFISSDLKPNMVRSMCCRLNLDLRELLKRGNGLFGSAEQTGCYDSETELYTMNGWKLFKDVKLEDKTLSMDINGIAELVSIDQLHEYEYIGEMIHFKGKGIDLLVTPNHRMVTVGHNRIKIRDAEEAAKLKTFDIPFHSDLKNISNTDVFILPDLTDRVINREYKSIIIPYKLWACFMGIYLSEGYCDKTDNRYRVIISQTKQHIREKIKQLLDELPFNYTESKSGFEINHKPLNYYLRQFGYQCDRYIPNDLKYQSKEVLENLITWLVYGDGNIHKHSGTRTYWTVSRLLANDIQEVLLLKGNNSSIIEMVKRKSSIKGREITPIQKCYVIHEMIRKSASILQKNITRVMYSGKVYCATVKHGTLLVRRNGKIAWCGNSIGVVTINCARLGYLFKNNTISLYQRLDYLLELAKNSLEIKRKVIQRHIDAGLFPYTKRYLGTLRNHFSTIGVNGINEMIRNFTNDNEDITTPNGHEIAARLLDHIRAKMIEFQETTGHMYNLEATPAEGTTYRFAKEDQKRYNEILQAGTKDAPYYTNSSQLPVGYTTDAFQALEMQEDLQIKYTGGTVLHLYMGERISNTEACKQLIKRALERFRVPYLTISPTFSICPIHGYIDGEHEFCPVCDEILLSKKNCQEANCAIKI